MEGLLATIAGLYLLVALTPVAVAARRGFARAYVLRVAWLAVTFGWTGLGLIFAWVMALEPDTKDWQIDITLR